MDRQCSEGVDHQAPGAWSSPYHIAKESEASDLRSGLRSYQDIITEPGDFRGDLPPKKTRGSFAPGYDGGGHLLDESTVGSQGYFTASTADYSNHSYRSKIATFSSGISEPYAKPAGLQRANFKGEDDEADKKLLSVNNKHLGPNLPQSSNMGYNAHTVLYHNQVLATDQQKSYDHEQAKKHGKTIKSNEKEERKAVEYYKKATYAVLIGNTIRVCNTKLYASLPLCNKCMVKERVKDSSGTTRVKLKLKTFDSSYSSTTTDQSKTSLQDNDNDDVETDDGDGIKHYYHRNCESPGLIIFTRDRKFRGDVRYPLPAEKATVARIGKGGNGFVFTLYHEKRQYAVKKTVYRSNEVNVHSALNHKNILPLAAVLMGKKHERHPGKFYCFHFMTRMDCDLRQILSTKEVGSLKHYYAHCSKDPSKFETAYNNVKYILMETLKGLEYLHSQGYIHRDVKASNIMIKMKNCKESPLHCNCTTKFDVKLGDFDSAGTVPGLGIKEPTDQLIKFASILPLGTPGYRAPEVSMHITLSGPYETLYTTGVDMWSFGCLCLNICIGKTAALKQREIVELQKTKPFSNDNQLLKLVRSCLQVDSKKRPTALQAQQYIEIKYS